MRSNATGSPKTNPTLRERPVGPSVLTVWRLTAAFHLGLAVSVVLLVALRLLGLRVGIVTESGVVVLTLLTALLLSRWRGRDGRE